MNEFFKTSDGVNAAQVGTEFEMGGGDIKPIPSNTRLKALIDDVKWTEYEGDRFIDLRWSVLEPDNYKNRKLFHKIKVFDGKAEKADKAKRMLAAIDANAGGGLVALGAEPTDVDLQSNLLNKIMLIEVQLWSMPDKFDPAIIKKGNWVSKVSSGKDLPAAAKAEDDIPF